MGITLYHSPGACSMATYISLLEAGAEFDVKITSLKTSDQLSPEYAAINPKKKVPYMVIDGKCALLHGVVWLRHPSALNPPLQADKVLREC